MAITKVGAMTDPPVAGDYAILQAKLDAYAKQVGNQGMILTEWTQISAVPNIAMGSYITHGGTLFIVDTEDFAVWPPTSDGTYYLKVATSGATLAVSWVASLIGYTWNAIYNGLYHADESQILPYQLVMAGGTLTKRKITNLMQGSGFVMVDWTGAMQSVYFNQGVKTTDSPTFAGLTLSGMINTGQGSTKIYKQTLQTLLIVATQSTGPRTVALDPMEIGEMRICTCSVRGENRKATITAPAGGAYIRHSGGYLAGGSEIISDDDDTAPFETKTSYLVMWRIS